MIKSKDPLYDLLEKYLNNLVDKKVNQYYDSNSEEYGSFNSFAQAAIYTTIFNLNHVDTVRSFQRIIRSPYTSNDAVTKQLVRISADRTTKVIAEKETERVLKNLDYVERTLNQAQIDIEKYNKLIKDLPSTVSRKEILERCLEEGKMYTGRDLSYKELNNLARDLENYKQDRVDYDEAIAINKEAISNGLPPVYTHKVWVWSQLENTRHSGMDGTVVELEEKFVVYNEVSGNIDHLDFPNDVENYSNIDNIINCQCYYEIIANDDNYHNYEDNTQLINDNTQIHNRLGVKSFDVTDYPDRNLIIGQIKGREGFIKNKDVLKSYDTLPKSLQDSISRIYVFDEALRTSGGNLILGQAAQNSNLINLYKSDRDLEYYNSAVLPHEASHLLYKNINVNEFKKAIEQDNIVNMLRSKYSYPSKYAEIKGIVEDFPESIRIALRDLNTFKKDFPNRYNYIKEFL